MPSFTLSFKVQFLLTLAVTSVFCVIYAFWIAQFNLSENVALKNENVLSNLRGKNAIIILGDSRVGSGLLPEYIEKAFNSTSYIMGGFGKKCIEGMIEVNDSQIGPSKIIIGVTPYGLFEKDLYTMPVSSAVAKVVAAGSFTIVTRMDNVLLKNIKSRTRLFSGYKYFIELLLWKQKILTNMSNGFVKIISLSPELSQLSTILEYNQYYNFRLTSYTDSTYIASQLKLFTSVLLELKKKHTVFLLRLPISNSLMSLEKQRYPNFDFDLQQIGMQTGCTYFNAMNYYHYPENNGDGSHLNYDAAKEFTKMILPILLESFR